MTCEACKGENRAGSKFCRHCGTSLSKAAEKSGPKLSWQNPAVIVVVGLIGLGILFYGSTSAYAYFHAQSQINSAKKMQAVKDYSGSLSLLRNLDTSALTKAQLSEVSTLTASDTEFANFKTVFNTAASEEASSTTSGSLMTAQASLETITPDYPDYVSVQAELVKVQNKIETSLQSENSANQKAAAAAQSAKAAAEAQAEEAEQTAANAQAAQQAASAEAQEAQNEANQAAAEAQQQAAQAAAEKTQQVEQTFINQLSNIQSNLATSCIGNSTTGINDYNARQYTDASYYIGAAATACQTAQTDATNLTDSYSNMPSSYTAAANDMYWAAYYVNESISDFLDTNYTEASSDLSESESYDAYVTTFLSANPD